MRRANKGFCSLASLLFITGYANIKRSACFMKKHSTSWLYLPGSKGVVTLTFLVVFLAASALVWVHSAQAATDTTAWQNGQMAMDTAGVVQRSNVILQSPNSQPTQSMPLGNGVLGAAAWSASGLTV